MKFLRVGDNVSFLTFTSSGKGHFHRFQRTKTNVSPKSESGRFSELVCAPSSSPDLRVFGDQSAHCGSRWAVGLGRKKPATRGPGQAMPDPQQHAEGRGARPAVTAPSLCKSLHCLHPGLDLDISLSLKSAEQEAFQRNFVPAPLPAPGLVPSQELLV